MPQKKETITIPESYTRQKLSALYKELPISDDVVKLLRKYLKAMANLYGILPLEHVYEIIINQNPGLLTKADFAKYITLACHEQEYFLLLGESDLYTNTKRHRTASMNGVLIDLLYVEMGDDYIDRLAELQGNKPYYIPEKNILLRYHDCNYSEPTPYTRAMKRFWHETINYSEKSAELILADLINLIRIVDFSMDDLQCFLEENHLDQITEEEMTEFLRLYTDLHNHTRMPCNRGYTPTELHDLLPRSSYAEPSISFGENMQRQLRDGSLDLIELKTAIMSADIPDEGLRQSMLEQLDGIANEPQVPVRHTKVGRNEPCPCGSGMKYKKCCGR